MEKHEDAELFSEEEYENILKQDFREAILDGVLVSKLAVLVAKNLNEPEDFIEEIRLAGFLHDIGKLRLSPYLYGRAKEALDIEEMKYIRMHAQFSYEILKEQNFSERVQKMVYHHHENYDGTGYPENLAGEQIPEGARILRICDMYCALLSKRPYRAAFDIEAAMETMIEEIKNFDMRIFLMFQRAVNSEEFAQIQDTLKKVNRPTESDDLLWQFIKNFEEEDK